MPNCLMGNGSSVLHQLPMIRNETTLHDFPAGGCSAGMSVRRGFSLVETLVVIVIITILISAAVGLSGNTRDKARRVTVDQMMGLVEQARTQAIATHSTVLLAIALPGSLAQYPDACAVSLVRMADGWDPSASAPTEASLLGRWRALETGVILGNGDVADLVNPLNARPLAIRITRPREVRAQVHGLAFNERGRLVYPVGSVPIVLRVTEGAYVRGAATPSNRNGRLSESLIKVGRVVGHPYEFTP